ncbi:fibrous sheath CABYR-binding protein-like [Astyanax mexicanus]|uniref:fibrous sheath CABYR-binding protein-like n=1 Tax=Astyanax mexicanus TaxID=7994 RepID=UPI0020CB3836|nr:fibrous sheath CABYR-binding protein-like [Astyanax mexicanus]
MVQMLKALIVPGVLAVAGCCWWWYSSRKKTPGTSQDSEEKEDELSSSSGEEQCAQSETRAPLSSSEELPLQDSVEDSQPDGQCAQSSPEELPLQASVDDSQPAWSSEGKRLLEEPITTIEDPQAEDTPVTAVELPELSVVDDLSSSIEDRQCAQSETGSISLPISTAAPVSSPEELPLQDSVDDSQPAWSSEGKRLLEEPVIHKDIPASFLGRRTQPRVLSTSVTVKPFFTRDKKYENTRESLSQVAWDTVMDDWY